MKHKVYYKIEANEVLTIKVEVLIVRKEGEYLDFIKGWKYMLIESENKIDAVNKFGVLVASLIDSVALNEPDEPEAQDVGAKDVN